MAEPQHPQEPVPPAPAFLPIRVFGAAAPFRWLRAGLADLRRAPAASLFYGAAFALMGWVLGWLFRNAVEYFSALAAGFLLVGPFLATGLYDIARLLERGEPVKLGATLVAWRARASSIGLYTLILVVIMLVWARASLVTFALCFTSGMPTLSGFVGQVFSLGHIDFLMAWTGVGAIFATLVFCSSVVTIPSMMERGTETIPAVIDSFRAVIANPLPMALWAAMIVALVIGGMALGFVGLVFTGPWVGLATWHAYREVLGKA